MKKFFCFILALTFIALSVTSISAEETLKTDIIVQKDGDISIVLSVQIPENSDACGGSFNLIYDSEKLHIKSANTGELLSGTSCMVNPHYKNGILRLVWAGTNAISGKGELLNVKFDILGNAYGSTDFILENLKLIDSNNERIDCVGSSFVLKLSEDASEETTGEKTEIIPPTKPNTPSKNSQSAPSVNNPEEDESEAFLIFQDVQENDWFYESVKYVFSSGLMKGVENNKFSPDTEVTRAMVVTILHRAAGNPTAPKTTFSDVDSNKWYYDGVSWAALVGITNGVGGGLFAPNESITREQMARMLYNYAVWRDIKVTEKATLSSFVDGNAVSEWASDAMQWAVGTGLIKGKDGDMLDPTGVATRAEIATILMRFTEKNNY